MTTTKRTSTAKASTAKASTAKAKIKATAASKRKSPKASVKTKVQPNAKFGAKRAATAKRVVSMRDTKQQSWGAIAKTLDVAPRTVRRLYDEVKGAGAHAGLLPGKGGRTAGS